MNLTTRTTVSFIQKKHALQQDFVFEFYHKLQNYLTSHLYETRKLLSEIFINKFIMNYVAKCLCMSMVEGTGGW